jgi:hypothetical protein
MARKKADEVLLLTLACGATVESAARKAGLGERTAYRRLADPTFQKRLSQTRAELVQRSASMLTAAGPDSIKTLLLLQQDATVPASVRRAAASSVLTMNLKYREQTDLQGRIAVLEQRWEASSSQP